MSVKCYSKNMSIKNTIAMRKRWAAVAPEKKFAMLSHASNVRWANTPKAKRKQIAKTLVEARKKKQHATA